jgi:tRNA dimethylallyltransferase
VAVEVARCLGGEIISMDSRQVYRGMDIGTAKPTPAEQGGVPHHGFDLVEPHQRFNAGRFAAFARLAMAEVRQRGNLPILAGGTGFFLKALTHPLFTEPPLDESRKERLKRLLATMSTERAAPLGRNASIRGRVFGRPIGSASAGSSRSRSSPVGRCPGGTHAPPAQPPIDPLIVVLDLPREVLNRRIDARVDAMLAQGLVGEVEALLGADTRAGSGLQHHGLHRAVAVPSRRVRAGGGGGGGQGGDTAVRAAAATWFRRQLPAGRPLAGCRPRRGSWWTTIVQAWREAER